MSVRCAGGILERGGANDLLKRASGLDAEVVLLDADRVCGPDHLESAVIHARRAFDRGSNSAKTLGMEVMLYASGERQISKAKKKMGLHQDSERIAVVLLSPDDMGIEQVLEDLGLERDDRFLECTMAKGEAFGLDPIELETLGHGRLQELVLEKVAFVELLKR